LTNKNTGFEAGNIGKVIPGSPEKKNRRVSKWESPRREAILLIKATLKNVTGKEHRLMIEKEKVPEKKEKDYFPFSKKSECEKNTDYDASNASARRI